MQTAVSARHFSPGAGMPGDRSARIAARRAFVALKQTFLQALEASPDTRWLRDQVLSAEEPVDLWLLRAPALAALAGSDGDQPGRRQLLRRGLDTMFPDLGPPSGFAPWLRSMTK